MRLPDKFRSKYFFSAILTALIICSVTWNTAAFHTISDNFYSPLTTTAADTTRPIPVADTTPRLQFTGSDTIRPPRDPGLAPADSFLVNDTMPVEKVDTFSLKLSKDTLDGPVHYYAEDSAVIMVQSKKIYLYGKTKTEYKDITLTAPKVEIDQQTQTLTAVNAKDSTGEVTEVAEFVQGTENSFTSDTIRYNFKTQKGLTKNTITQQGEMFVHFDVAKKVDANTTFGKGGFITTCNLSDHPHFGFRASRMKVVNQKLAVTGAIHPEFEDVPVPIYLPFGFFPLSQGRHSGFLPPQFATNETQGLGLEGLGYYKVINDYWDAKVYGNVYSYGSWSANLNPTYRKRYKYSGSANIGYMSTKRNFKNDPDFSKSSSYTVSWSHTSDTRARPGTSFSARVNASSTNYNRNVPNNAHLNFQNILGSSITYSKTWIGRPYNLTLSANHSQNNRNREVSISLPDAGFTVSTLYPLQKKEAAGPKKWYEQLGIGYQGNFRNSVSFYDSINYKQVYGKSIFSYLADTLQWGAQHNIPVTLALPAILNGALVVTPSVAYSQIWANRKTRYTWNTATQRLDTTSTKGFFIDQQTQFSLAFNTALYGTYQFRNKKIMAIRHVVRPTFSINYRPDLSTRYYYRDTIAPGYTQLFGELQNIQPYSGYSPGRSGSFSFGIDNNVEMKVRSRKDTTGDGIRKIRLIDGLSIVSSYDFFRDSLKLSPFALSFRTNLFDKINITASGILDPYQANAIGQPINKFVWDGGRFRLGRLSTASISISTSFQSKPKDPEKDKKRKEAIKEQLNDPTLQADQQRLLDYMRQNPGEFVDFNVPWSINVSYSLVYSTSFSTALQRYLATLNSNVQFNGSFNLTPKWNFSSTGFFDFKTKRIQTFSMAISRDMHCWQLSINVTPTPPFRYFSFTISPKSSVLQDLKVNRTRSFVSY